MQDKKFYLGEGDDKVLLAFNMNSMAEIQGEFGSIQGWVNLLEDDKKNPQRNGEPDMKALISGFTYMLNEGVDIENEESEKSKAFYTPKQVGRLITKWGQAEVAMAMKTAIAGSVNTGEKAKKEQSTTTTPKPTK